METSYTLKAFEDGHLRLDKSAKTEKVVYVAVNRGERWSDPEEKVRAEFYAELIYRYGYSGTGFVLFSECSGPGSGSPPFEWRGPDGRCPLRERQRG